MSRDTSVQRRLERLGATRVRGGLLSTEEAAALADVGLHPVSEVIGAIASTVSGFGLYGPGSASPWGGSGSGLGLGYRTHTSSTSNSRYGLPTAVTAFKSGNRSALNRMLAEARAVGADGVVGVKVQRTVSYAGGMQMWSFLAIGTAVRSAGRTHPSVPFTTDLSGAQTAAAIRGGWVPVSYLAVPCIGIRYLDAQSSMQLRALATNGEIDAFSDVVNTTRHQARQDFARAAAEAHADGAVLSGMTLRLEGGLDQITCVAEVTITGTALARFRAPATRARTPLMVIPLARGRGI
ncbi:MAG TPA: heavy metal-binding domain-containing protein [Jatrophihabitantaceae bacterium]|jgi:uncharacterized protein YbjQ (UPF0145 family)|nr:heavy metal-binding domain-containing protein [Jatrophihabitantaceae bacterium]